MRQLHISGIGGQALSSNIEGQWGPFGPALFVEGLSRNILSVGVVSSFYPVFFQSRPATSSAEAVQGCYGIKLGKKLSITFLPNEERLYAFHCPRSLLNYQADSRLHRSHVLEARRTSRFQLADANNEDNHEYVYYLCLTNLHDLSDCPLDRNTHVVSIPKSPQWQHRTEQYTLITSEATRAAYVLHHPYSVLVYRFSFVHGRSSDNENDDDDYIYSFYRTSSHIITTCNISTNEQINSTED